MIFINQIVAPLDAPQIFKPPPAPPKPARLDWLEEQLLAHLREVGSCPIWSLVDIVVNDQHPRDRTAGRLLGLDLLERLKRLREKRLAFPVGRNWVSVTKPDPARQRSALRRRRPSVSKSPPNCAVSATAAPESGEGGRRANQVQSQMDKWKPAPPLPAVDAEKTKSAPASELASAAGRRLAILPRQPKRIWSGFVGSVRTYRNMPVRLPDGEHVYVFGARRGMVVYVREPDMCAGDPEGIGKSWGVLPASAVRILKNEHAVALGGRKRGVKEAFSPRKVAAARANGRRPPREGHRPRGRPHRTPSPVAAPQHPVLAAPWPAA